MSGQDSQFSSLMCRDYWVRTRAQTLNHTKSVRSENRAASCEINVSASPSGHYGT